MGAKYISCAETAKLVRKALKESFPNFKFGVKSKRYSGGASITIYWTDGPTQKEVQEVTDCFAGASFDGMIDLKSHHTSELNGERVSFGADYVFTSRSYSARFLRDRVIEAAFQFGHDIETLPRVVVDGGLDAYVETTSIPICEGAQESFTDYVHSQAHQTSALQESRYV